MRVMILMILEWMASNAGKRGSWAGRYEVHTCVGVFSLQILWLVHDKDEE